MSISVAALAIALVALGATLVVALLVVRGRRASDERLSAGLEHIGAKMEGLARELAAAVDKVRRDATRTQAFESLKQPLDPTELVTRCVEAAAALPGVAAASAALDVQGTRLEAAAGAVAGTPVTEMPGPPGGTAVRAVAVSYHYADAASVGRLQSAIAVPLHGRAGGRLGFLTVFGSGEDPPVSGDVFLDLEEIARQAGPAVEAAALREEMSPMPPDPVTGLPARRELHETLALEVAKTKRQRGRLTLCLLELAGSGATAGLAADEIVADAAAALRDAAGPTDIVFRHGATAFAVIIRNGGRIEGEALVARLGASLAGDTGGRVRLDVSAGIAELKDDDDGLSLFARAERALRREHGAGSAS